MKTPFLFDMADKLSKANYLKISNKYSKSIAIPMTEKIIPQKILIFLSALVQDFSGLGDRRFASCNDTRRCLNSKIAPIISQNP